MNGYGDLTFHHIHVSPYLSIDRLPTDELHIRFLESYAFRQEKIKTKNSKSKIIYFQYKYRFGSHVNIQVVVGTLVKTNRRRFRRNFGGCLSLTHIHTVWCLIDVAGEDDGWAWVIRWYGSKPAVIGFLHGAHWPLLIGSGILCLLPTDIHIDGYW